jgi:hypothetical protein
MVVHPGCPCEVVGVSIIPGGIQLVVARGCPASSAKETSVAEQDVYNFIRIQKSMSVYTYIYNEYIYIIICHILYVYM